MPGTQTVLTISELKALASPGSADVYYITDNGRQGEFRYDPSDTTTPGDDALVIEAVGNPYRYKRITDEFINVNWFGAVGDNITDDGPAFNRMFTALSQSGQMRYKVVIPAATYYIATTISLPTTPLLGNYHLYIYGDGAKLRTDRNIPIMARLVTSANAGTMISDYRCHISGLLFEGNITLVPTNTLQVGLKLQAIENWTITNCNFNRTYNGLEAYFSLKCLYDSLEFVQPGNIGMIGRYGDWSGAGTTNSAFNANMISNCRCVNYLTTRTSLQLLAADQTIVKNFVSEGYNPLYNFEYDYLGSTGVSQNIFEDIWLESIGGTNTQNVNFKVTPAATLIIRNAQRTYPNQLFDFTGAQSSCNILIDGLSYVSTRPTSGLAFMKVPNTLSGCQIKFINIQSNQGDFLRDPATWEGGIIPQNMEVEYTLGANGGKIQYSKGIKIIESDALLQLKSRQSIPSTASQWMDVFGTLSFPTDNKWNIGGSSTTNFRPARVSANRFLADPSSTYGFGFGDNAANPVDFINRPIAGVIKVNSNALELPKGATAQRPTGSAARFRYNTDLNIIEWFDGTDWIQPLTNLGVTRVINSNAAALTTDGFLEIDTSVGDVTITVDPLLFVGKHISLKKVSPANNMIVSGPIEGSTSASYSAQYSGVTLTSNASGTMLYVVP